MHILDTLLSVPPLTSRDGDRSHAERDAVRRRRCRIALATGLVVLAGLVVLFVLIGGTASAQPTPSVAEAGESRTVVSTDSAAGVMAIVVAALVVAAAVAVAIALIVRRPVPACPADAD